MGSYYQEPHSIPILLFEITYRNKRQGDATMDSARNKKLPDGESHQTAEILDRRQACAFLNIAPSTLYHRVSDGSIPVLRIGRKLVFIRSELLKWLTSGQASR